MQDPYNGADFDESVKRELDYKKITDIQFEDVDYKDYPDFCDAFIVSAKMNGFEMNEAELDELNQDSEFVHEKLMEYLF
jgi:hypothetical protein